MTGQAPRALRRGPAAWIATGIAAIVVVAAIVIGLNLGGSPATSPTPTASRSAGEPTPTLTASATPTGTATLPPPSAPDIAWQRLEGALDAGADVAGVTNINGRWFVTGKIGDAPAIWTSDDAVPRTWSKATLDTAPVADHYAQVRRVLPNGDNLIAFGFWGANASEQVSWITWDSTDGGATWTEARRDEAGLQAVIEGGARFIGAGWDSGGTTPFDSFISTSADGITWVRTNPAAMRNSEVAELAAIGDRLVAVGSSFAEDGSTVTAAWYSDDQGRTWTAGDTGGGVGTLYDVTSLGQGLVAVGGTGAPTAWLTDDGITWRAYPMGSTAIASSVAAMEAGGVVAAGNDAAQDIGPEHTWSSLDGITWIDGGDLDPPGPRGARIAASAAFGTAVVMGGSCLVVDPRLPPCPTPLWLGLPRE